jgi:hypothetical protein
MVSKNEKQAPIVNAASNEFVMRSMAEAANKIGEQKQNLFLKRSEK